MFTKYYNGKIELKDISPFKIIHGYGSSGTVGEIKSRVRQLLTSSKSSLKVAFGEDIDGNPGYTIVYPQKRLSGVNSELKNTIINLCQLPFTQSQIISKLIRRYSEPQIIATLKELEKLKVIKSTFKNGVKHYVVL